MSYDWKAALVFLATLVALSALGYFLAFRVPALRRMREQNRAADAAKLARPRYAEAVKTNNRAALATNGLFFVAVLPFCIALDARPLWRNAIDVVAVLMVFDFLYYLVHRFLFHGRALRRMHALHHQARTPTYVDGLYVHPVETAIGLLLFLGSIPLVAAIAGGPLNAVAMAVATLVFTQLNSLNHTFVDLHEFPFRTLDRITALHAAHHVDMNRGNFATLTMLYDRLFGTLEAPVHRSTP